MITIDNLIEAINDELEFGYGINLSKDLGRALVKSLKELQQYKTSDEENDIVYIVRIKNDIEDKLFYKTTCSNIFSGRLVNKTDSNLFLS